MKIRLYIIIGAILLLITNFFIYRLIISDQYTHSQSLELCLSEIGKINNQLDKQTLFVKQTKIRSYDDIVLLSQQIENKKDQLETEFLEVNAYLINKKEIKTLTDIINQKKLLIENFKSKNSILRNSLNAVGVLIEGQKFSSISEDLNNLENVLMKYNLYRDYQKEKEIKNSLINIKEKYNLSSREYKMFTAHVNMILDLEPEIDKILQQIINVEITELSDQINDSIEEYSQQYLVTLKSFLFFFIALNFFSFLIIVYVVIKLSKKSKELVEFNESLEEKVKNRTTQIAKTIEEVKQKNNELRIAEEEALQSAIAKQNFLANMSHEIRTPINGIDGMAKLLEDTPIDEEQKEYLSAIRASADNLLIIINDILDITKIEAGKLTIEKIGFNLEDTLNRVIKSINYKAEEKGILLTLDVDENIPKILLGDPTRINQVIINLISNAIKFTSEGSVTLVCSLIRRLRDEVELKFKIVDTGIGIEREKLESVFESFSQEDETTTRKYGGTGLGLAISKELVELFGGQLKVESEKGVGSTFYFEINLPIGNEGDLVRDEKYTLSIESVENKKVLLVEDHEINRLLAISLLKKWNMLVDVAENGEIAIEMMKEKDYDVVLMDMQMPVMGGVEATQIIRKELKLSTPIIALTASAIKGADKECIDAGMDDYISKPFDHSNLFNKILKMINNRKIDTI